jgi:nucleotide-binding universal stress UspA family protein
MSTPARRRPVVAGVDGSETSIQAAVDAAREALRRRAPLLLVHATPWAAEGAAAPSPTPDVRRLMVDSARTVVASAEDRVREATGIREVGTGVLAGAPVAALSTLSADAELLVLGHRGAGGMSGLLLGSTAKGLVEHARCPVLVLPDRTTAVVHDRTAVVVAVEGRPDDEQVLAAAVTAAATRRTDLVAVHAWRDMALETAAMQAAGPLIDWAGVAGDEERLLAEAVAGWRDEEPDVTIREVVVRDRAASALVAASLTAELLVVGHRHRTVLPRLGSTTHGVLHRATCPVLVVPIHT